MLYQVLNWLYSLSVMLKFILDGAELCDCTSGTLSHCDTLTGDDSCSNDNEQDNEDDDEVDDENAGNMPLSVTALPLMAAACIAVCLY